MQINDIFYDSFYLKLKKSCSQFLNESAGLPLLKCLPSTYGNFHRVKIRKRKQNDSFVDSFNEAFNNKHENLRQRAIFANGVGSLFANGVGSFDNMFVETNMDVFYIFPIDGYRFLYSKEVENSSEKYKEVFETVLNNFGTNIGNEVFTDILRFNYTDKNLHEGIESGAEIILYGIPFYYAVRKNNISSYETLLTYLK